MKIVEPTTLAYLAGMIDGDGYISITRGMHKGRLYFGPQVGIAGTRREPHDLASSIWGGKVSCYEPKNSSHRSQYQWSRVGQMAVVVIQSIVPYLLIKRGHAEFVLDFWDFLEAGKTDDPYPWMGPGYSPVPMLHEMREDMIDMNQSRNRSGKHAAGRLLDGRTWDEMPA
jgi:hypothetical protein